MKLTGKELIKEMEKLGFMINPFGEKYCSLKIGINNCEETTYYFIEAEDPFEKKIVLSVEDLWAIMNNGRLDREDYLFELEK